MTRRSCRNTLDIAGHFEGASVTPEDEDRTIPIPGPRDLRTTFAGGVWCLVWYGMTAIFLIRIVTGRGGMLHSDSIPLELLAWAVFAGLPLVIVRYVAWNTFGWEHVCVRDGIMTVRRSAWGIPLFRREEYEGARISNLHDVGPSPSDNGWAPALRPDTRGAIAFDYGVNTIYFGAALLNDRDTARELAALLRRWLGLPS